MITQKIYDIVGGLLIGLLELVCTQYTICVQSNTAKYVRYCYQKVHTIRKVFIFCFFICVPNNTQYSNAVIAYIVYVCRIYSREKKKFCFLTWQYNRNDMSFYFNFGSCSEESCLIYEKQNTILSHIELNLLYFFNSEFQIP